MWGVAFPREWVDVAWTSFGRRSDVVFSSIYHIPYLTLHFQIHYSFHNKPLSKTIHERLALPPMQLKNPTLPTGYYFWNFRHRLVRYYWYQLIKMKQRFLLHLDGDLGCGHDIGMTSWKLHLDGGKQIFSTQAWLRHEFRAFLYPLYPVKGMWKEPLVGLTPGSRNSALVPKVVTT